tara:strand:- start:1368 stop:1727 length:360 start_codon:yes stop_codon:yes gene_type:complete
MKTNEQKETFFNKISEDLEFDIMDYLQTDELGEINAYDDLEVELNENGAYDIEIIYYYKAMQYLIEHDTSLSESMAIAQEYGYEPNNINSELLASLLASQNARDEFYDLQNEIDEFLTD